MKRYDFMCEDCGCTAAGTEWPDGEYVEAEVAQALYDQLKVAVEFYRSEMTTCEEDDNGYVAGQWRERLELAEVALSMADGADNE